jgi:hypothetical protein
MNLNTAAVLLALSLNGAPLLAAGFEHDASQASGSFQRELAPSDIRFVSSTPLASPALVARVSVQGETLMAGAAADAAAQGRLDCAAATVQHTVRSCRLAAAALPSATCLGRRVDGVNLNVHFQGRVINMSVEFSAGTGADDVLSQLTAAFGRAPTVQYWADAGHLYSSSIWVDGRSEVELTKTVRGDAGDGKVRLYVSSLLGGLPISPDDLPQN